VLKEITTQLQRLIPAHHSRYEKLQQVSFVRKIIPTNRVEFRPGHYKGKLFGFVAEFEINGETYEINSTTVSSKTLVDCYLVIDTDGSTIIYTV